MIMKKRHLIFAAVFLSAVFSLNATGAGVQAGFFPAFEINQDGIKADTWEANLTGTLSFMRLPLTAGAGLIAGTCGTPVASTQGTAEEEASGGTLGVSLFADYWIFEAQLKNIWNLYSGFGAQVALRYNFNDDFILTASPRFFAGMNWLFIDGYMEFYIQQNFSPAFQLALKNRGTAFKMYLPFESGIRLHF